MKDLNEKELMKIDGGMNDRPFGTSYDGYPTSGGGEKKEESLLPGWLEILIAIADGAQN
ncbi:hypothetical protein [Marinifilum fragile]|uniref:hypothetical protein n=1 Tax=Marinifilum fragile TaxID=570161 RepID=UPI002AA76F5C|nr:hypothetical protein [Marinifilum fragile]